MLFKLVNCQSSTMHTQSTEQFINHKKHRSIDQITSYQRILYVYILGCYHVAFTIYSKNSFCSNSSSKHFNFAPLISVTLKQLQMALSCSMILFTILVIIFTIFLAFPQYGVACRTLQEDQWFRQCNGILLQALPRGPVMPSSPDPIRP